MVPWVRPLSLCLTLCLPGCVGLGARALNRDHLDYARALSDAEKRETLFNIVRFRYGDSLVFLSTSQVISGYTFEGSAEAGVTGNSTVSASASLAAPGTFHYSDHPTFTFAPVTGEQLAQSYIRPLSPGQLLPWAQSGLPIDVLLRLGVQSIGDLRNSSPLGGLARSGSPDFFRLVADLRVLQVAGALALRVQADAKTIRIFLLLEGQDDPLMRRVEDDVRRLLAMGPGARDVEIVYGSGRPDHGRVAILTRSILGMLGEVAAQIDVPEQDVRTGRTLASAPAVTPDTQPVIAVHSGPERPSTGYVALRHDGRWFWIDDLDFKSKLALSILDLMRNVAESGQTRQAPLITIPAG